MKVTGVTLKGFKQFRDRHLDFTDSVTGLPSDLKVVVGPNGSGKSTLLQAIAGSLGTATQQLAGPAELDWPGFDLELAEGSWRVPLRVEVSVRFDSDENAATRAYWNQLFSPRETPSDIVPPGDEPEVTLVLEDGNVQASSPTRWFQFRGYEYAKQIVRSASEGYDVFKRVGRVFWYTEQRTTNSLTASDDENGTHQITLPLLRRRLANLQHFHDRVSRGDYKLRPGQRDIYNALEEAYEAVFPGRGFDGAVPRLGDNIYEDPWFFLHDDSGQQYELSEMSGGERAVFPLLFDFANWAIHRSVILIDEIELHLHPPMQQALLRALTKLGKDNQFIVTTHSESVRDIVPEESILHMGEPANVER